MPSSDIPWQKLTAYASMIHLQQDFLIVARCFSLDFLRWYKANSLLQIDFRI